VSKRREDTDIDHFLLPRLKEAGIDPTHLRRNETTRRTTPYRGDLWISLLPHSHEDYEDSIITLIECKDRKATPGDRDWKTAIADGRLKAKRQGLKAFFVTNTETHTRSYSAHDGLEISVDGEVLNTVPTIPILRAIQAQVSPARRNVLYRTFASRIPNANSFRSSLWSIRQIFRAKGISRGEEDKSLRVH